MDVMTDVLGVVSGGLEALRAKATLGDLIFFSLINDYLSEEITGRFSEALNNMFGWVSGMVLIAMTLWVWWQGFLIVTGRSRESMLSFVAQAAQRVFIVSVALGASVGGTEVFDWLAEDLPREINLVVTGDDESAYDTIDRNLGYMQIAMSSIDAIHTGGDPSAEASKTRALWFAGIGTSGPAIVGGAMLLLNKIALSMFIAFAPMFILALMFDFTKPLFSRWLYYGLATMFSLAMLNLMVSIATELVIRVASYMWVGSAIAALTGLGEEGLTSRAMQQGGIGLILTTMIISTPPMAGAFFNGVLGQFSAYNVFRGEHGPGAQGNGSPPVHKDASASTHSRAPGVEVRMTHASQTIGMADVPKTGSTLGNAMQPPTPLPSGPQSRLS